MLFTKKARPKNLQDIKEELHPILKDLENQRKRNVIIFLFSVVVCTILVLGGVGYFQEKINFLKLIDNYPPIKFFLITVFAVGSYLYREKKYRCNFKRQVVSKVVKLFGEKLSYQPHGGIA
ncbi:MAG: hypothetical protein WCG27_07510, partial [Pseudomonadota bacterium]